MITPQAHSKGIAPVLGHLCLDACLGQSRVYAVTKKREGIDNGDTDHHGCGRLHLSSTINWPILADRERPLPERPPRVVARVTPGGATMTSLVRHKSATGLTLNVGRHLDQTTATPGSRQDSMRVLTPS